MKEKSQSFALAAIGVFSLIGMGISSHEGSLTVCRELLGSEVRKQTSGKQKVIPQVPGFADRSQIPAEGKQGPPAKAATLLGNRKQGGVLFTQYCQSCHGPQGIGKVPNPGSTDGTVPPLNPIDSALANKKPALFATNIDRFIQHGSLPDGKSPALFMPNWGDSKQLSQEEIADLESYIMSLNGVKR